MSNGESRVWMSRHEMCITPLRPLHPYQRTAYYGLYLAGVDGERWGCWLGNEWAEVKTGSGPCERVTELHGGGFYQLCALWCLSSRLPFAVRLSVRASVCLFHCPQMFIISSLCFPISPVKQNSRALVLMLLPVFAHRTSPNRSSLAHCTTACSFKSSLNKNSFDTTFWQNNSRLIILARWVSLCGKMCKKALS